MDDDALERLLKDAMASEPPELSRGFEARVMRRVRPRTLSSTGRIVLSAYAVVASAVVVWAMREVPLPAVMAAAGVGVPLAGAVSAYAHRVVLGRA